jgi:hypothetical protein
MMFVGTELLESVPLDKELISKPGYVGNFKRRLQNKYRELFASEQKPQFYVANSTTEINPMEMTIRG